MAQSLATVIDGKKKSRTLGLDDIDPGDTRGWKKEAALERLETLGTELAELTNLLSYAAEQSLLVIFQGRDASGKDGAIRKVLSFANVLAAKVRPFKVPTEEERAHDFLWRVHKVVPPRGELALFNRSHYEDVIAVRVHELLPEKIWRRRYDAINDFERLLVDNHTIVVKFCLHVSRAEQRKRLIEREQDPRTAWKLNVNDWREIPLWKATTRAYDDVLARCSSPELPWHVVPADQKWFRNLAVFETLVERLRPYKSGWQAKLKAVRAAALKEIEALRRKTR